MKRIFSLLFIFGLTVLPVYSQPANPPKEKPKKEDASALVLPPDQKVHLDEGFITIQAQCKGEVKWLVVSQGKVKYIPVPGNVLIVAIPPKAKTLIDIFAIAAIDGKLTEFAHTSLLVEEEQPKPPEAPPLGSDGNPPVVNPIPPVVNPTPPVANPPAGGFHITFIIDMNVVSPQIAQIVNSPVVRNVITSRGKPYLYDMHSNKLVEKGLDKIVKKVGGNAVIVIQDANGPIVYEGVVPNDEKELIKLINKHTVK